MKVWLLLLPLILITSSVDAKDAKVSRPKIGAPTGFVVVFKGPAETDFTLRDALHKKNGLKLVYRAKNLPIDELAPRNSKELRKPVKELEAFCRKYQKSDIVRSCEVTTERTPPVSTCPPQDKNISNLSSTAKGLSAHCDLVNAKNYDEVRDDGILSPLWAQNLIGSDLAKARMAEIDATQKGAVREINVGDIDAGFSKKHITGKSTVNWSHLHGGKQQDHGTKVVNLINGKGDYSSGYKVNISVLADGYTHSYIKAVDKVLSNPPEILNFEFHSVCMINGSCSKDPLAFKDGLDALTHKTIVVAAAGNYYGKTTDLTDPALAGTILVGSADPNGLVSDFSDEDPHITILAPSDYYLYAPGIDGVDFSGTSGATPLVTGALANVKSLLGRMNVWEAKTLLQQTATPLLVTNHADQKNGVGLLNAYKLVRVAERMKKQGWPEKNVDLKSPELYDFKEEASGYSKEASDILAKSTDCKSLSTALKLYRKSFLLEASNSTADQISAILEKTNYIGDAAFYKNRHPENLMADLKNATTDEDALISEDAANRNLKLLDKK